MVDPARLLKGRPGIQYSVSVPPQTPVPGPDWLTVPLRTLDSLPPRLNDP